MVLATADAEGVPWASPVYFAADGYRDFYWVSTPAATHSQNVAARPQVGIVVFDSGAAVGDGQGVYMRADAEEVGDDEMQRGLEVFSLRSRSHGGRPWTTDDVTGEAPYRLYRARASEYSMLAKDDAPDHRVPVDVSEGGPAT
ncbi:hypothetical protein BH18ACT17_BH18ACT17_09370 [soil metagenome]